MFGTLVKRHGEFFVKGIDSNALHHVEDASGLFLGSYLSYEVNENDDAVDIIPAEVALMEWGIRPDTGSFYSRLDEDGHSVEEPNVSFGTCELSGIRGNLVHCLYLSTDGEIIELQVGDWLVGSVLGSLAGAF